MFIDVVVDYMGNPTSISQVLLESHLKQPLRTTDTGNSV
jgi:hypothetical protein